MRPAGTTSGRRSPVRRPPEITTRDIADLLTLPPDHYPPPVEPGGVRDWFLWWHGQYGVRDPYAHSTDTVAEAAFVAGYALAHLILTTATRRERNQMLAWPGTAPQPRRYRLIKKGKTWLLTHHASWTGR
jgi:hypothetical protein